MFNASAAIGADRHAQEISQAKTGSIPRKLGRSLPEGDMSNFCGQCRTWERVVRGAAYWGRSMSAFSRTAWRTASAMTAATEG